MATDSEPIPSPSSSQDQRRQDHDAQITTSSSALGTSFAAHTSSSSPAPSASGSRRSSYAPIDAAALAASTSSIGSTSSSPKTERSHRSGAIRRGAYRNVASLATASSSTRASSDLSASEDETGASAARNHGHTRRMATSRNPSTLIRSESYEAGQRTSSPHQQRADEPASLSRDGDGMFPSKLPAESKSIHQDLETRRQWQPIGQRLELMTPPGGVIELPSMTSYLDIAPDNSSSIVAPSAPEIDWANFVHAYSRGRFNPAKPPMAPGRSTAVPGSLTRIVLEPENPENTAVEGCQKDKSVSIGRRPSLDYEDADLAERVAAATITVPDGPNRSHEEPLISGLPARRLSLKEAADLVLNTGALTEGATINLPAEIPSKPSDAAPLGPTRSSLKYTEGLSAGADTEIAGADQATKALLEAERKATIQFGTNSAPQLPVVGKGPQVDKALAREARRPSEPQGHELYEGPLKEFASQGAGARALRSSIAPLDGVRGAQNNDKTRSGMDGDSESQTPFRPAPTPIQISDLNPLSRPQAPLWQSEPDSVLESWRRSSATVEAGSLGNDVSPAAADLGSVQNLRRAARRVSVMRQEDQPQMLSRPVGISTVSWSSDPGALRSAPPPTFEDLDPLALLSPVSPASKAGSSTADLHNYSFGVAGGDAKAAMVCPLPSARASTTFADDLLVDSRRRSSGRHPANIFQRKSESQGSGFLSSYVDAGKQAERFYQERGYLPAIIPPDEEQRRRALFRYGPPQITGNPDFDRIGHLVRLSFSCRITLISLVGANEQIFQTAVGGGGEVNAGSLHDIASSRHCSFCAHAILQQSDEPLVVLDASKDWRFMGNPLVRGPPHIRFYAGCPLRTSDGHNLGSLCIIDSEPRTEFGPRQRHILKEFGGVVMRELELKRDRIHLATRDRMQKAIEVFTRHVLEMEIDTASTDETNSLGTMQHLYNSAAESVQETLEISGSVLFDLSHFELAESPESPDENGGTGSRTKIYYPGPLDDDSEMDSVDNFHSQPSMEMSRSRSSMDDLLKNRTAPPMAVLGASEDEAAPASRDARVPLLHHLKVAELIKRHRSGAFFLHAPDFIRRLLPPDVTNVLLVPVFGINKQPFSLLCAYTKRGRRMASLEDVQDSALQYIRSMGTIILSAVLKKDIVLADQAKSHFISNISHELRTPLHGILASAELLSETKLNATQGSYLETVEACGKSLLELVNHVLDFTKLSGGAKSKSANVHALTPVDLVKLMQEVCESSWIGQMARKLESQQTSGIGSAYANGSGIASGSATQTLPAGAGRQLRTGDVETVIDVSLRSEGWLVHCDAGGIRRCLMNLIGNALKFTTSGFVHVSLREIKMTAKKVVVELSVTDTGKGISRGFLEEQLFHPFTQENQLGPGTGLGLSIVNSIIQSPSIQGKIDVWSTVGEGTEMRITCELLLAETKEVEGPIYQPSLSLDGRKSAGFLGFDEEKRGQADLKQVFSKYVYDWWGFAEPMQDDHFIDADLLVINEDFELLSRIRKHRGKLLPPVVVLTSARGDPEVTEACAKYHKAGGVARMLFKPAGPAKLEAVLDFCLQYLDRVESGEPPAKSETAPSTPLPSPAPSPATRLDLEESDSYFAGSQERRRSHPTIASIEEDGDADHSATTPLGWSAVATDKDDKTPKHSLPLLLKKDSAHISPKLVDVHTAQLVRRHSTEDEVVRARNELAAAHAESDTAYDKSKSAASVATGESPLKSGRRPMMAPRSITFHREPMVDKKSIHLSPSLQRELQSRENPNDYFGARSASASRAHAVGLTPDVDSSSSTATTPQLSTTEKPSLIPIDGSDSQVLRSAVGSVSGQPNRRLRVMGVDDNEINLKILEAFCDKIGNIDFVAARNGLEAYNLWQAANLGVSAEDGPAAESQSAPFDIIILDVMMPVMDGLQATSQIRRKEREVNRTLRKASSSKSAAEKTSSASVKTIKANGAPNPASPSRVSVLVLTGRSGEDDMRRSFAAGVDGFLPRPLSRKVLQEAIRLLTQK